MADKQVYIKDIGDILFVKNGKAKNLRIVITPKKGIRVTIPRFITFDYAYKFVEKKKKWIKKSIDKFASSGNVQTMFQPGVKFKTHDHELVFEHADVIGLKAKIGNGKIVIYYPEYEHLLSCSSQIFIRRAIEFALRSEAKEILQERASYLAGQYNFSYRTLRVKNLKSRWGSCSSVNNINLNIHLLRLPGHLIDYVILHELVHTVHKNHGKIFWDTLNKITGDAIGLRNEMKQYQTQVY